MKTLKKIVTLVILVCSMNVYSNDSISCLSEAAYHEARGDGISGMQAVMMVIINRTKYPHIFSKSICGVVHQKGQFSYLQKKHRKYDSKLKKEVDKLAKSMYNAYLQNDSEPKNLSWARQALFYNTVKFGKGFVFIKQEKNHLFYTLRKIHKHG